MKKKKIKHLIIIAMCATTSSAHSSMYETLLNEINLEDKKIVEELVGKIVQINAVNEDRIIAAYIKRVKGKYKLNINNRWWNKIKPARKNFILMHELAHIYDLDNSVSVKVGKKYHPKKKIFQREDRYINKPLSSTRDYLVRFKWGSPRNSFNKNSERLISGNEKISSKESFADNFASYILDDEYGFRKPYSAMYFDDLLGRCFKPVSLVVPVSGRYQKIGFNDLMGIYLLHISPGGEIFNRYGHLALLVELTNKRSLVIEFIGILNDENTIWDSVTNSIPLKVVIQDADRFIIEKTWYNERKILKYGLISSSNKDKWEIFSSLVQDHFLYRGNYNFFFKNCATEIRDLVTYHHNKRRISRLIFSPNKIIKKLLRRNCITKIGPIYSSIGINADGDMCSYFRNKNPVIFEKLLKKNLSFDNIVHIKNNSNFNAYEILLILKVRQDYLASKYRKNLLYSAYNNESTNEVRNEVKRLTSGKILHDENGYGIPFNSVLGKESGLIKIPREQYNILHEDFALSDSGSALRQDLTENINNIKRLKLSIANIRKM